MSWYLQAKPPHRVTDEKGDYSPISMYMDGGGGAVSLASCSERHLQKILKEGQIATMAVNIREIYTF